MANRLLLWILALLMASPAKTLNAGHPEQPREASDTAGAGTLIVSGIRPRRLTQKQLGIWRSIQSIVFAMDASGRFKYPELQSLWQRADRSGHAIYVEFCKPPFRWASAAGDFHVEQRDPGGQERAGVIRLYISVIDRVQVSARIQKMLGFVPFLGLRKTERYAEVLGHELTHAVWILAHPDLIDLSTEPANAAQETCECNHQRRSSDPSHGDMSERLIRLESRMGELEARARAAELEIWRELLAGRREAPSFQVDLP